MAFAGDAPEHDDTEALLWSAPTGPLPAPPVATLAQVLPIGELEWADAERLFLRLLHTVRPVQYAKLFGVPGQVQEGIDAYARLPLELISGQSGGRSYITLQSRRVEKLTAGKIKMAVDDLLKGDWAERTETFYFATSFDLQDTKLDAPIRQQTERLADLGIKFIPWGAQEVSGLLKDQARIVDEFFGRPWVERFCGPAAAGSLANNLPSPDSRKLRAELRTLYAAVFHAHGGPRNATNVDVPNEFVVLDVDPHRHETAIVDTNQSEPGQEDQKPADDGPDGFAYIASRLGAARRSLRSAHRLLNRPRPATPSMVGAVAADEWLAGGRYRLLLGRPGAGKSSLLRFIATDLLSPRPQSTALQREHATDLPVWLPFGFLCRHLRASEDNSLVSATQAWLSSLSAGHLWPLVQRALQDDRLLLLVDGIDEWSDIGAAEHALGILETFLGVSKASAMLSTRPYAVDRLNWTRPWAQAEITPLTDGQRRMIATGILQPGTPDSDASGSPVSGWTIGVGPFLDQLDGTSELAELSRSPLFLTLLATTWHGEPLPRQRFKIYERLVDLLIEKHPQMRQRAYGERTAPLTATEATTLFAAVAYRLRIKDPAGTVTTREMRRLIVESLTDDDVLGYQQPEARRIADAVMAMAEREFGLIVSQGGGLFGFLHRVLLDHLAGQYLATLPEPDQADAVQRFVHDPAWRDVLLALLTGQHNPHTTHSLLTAALESGGQRWVDIDGHELLAEALAAGVKLAPKSQAHYLDVLVDRVQTHPVLAHRAHLVTALVGTLAGRTARGRLLPVMTRWLTARRPDPASTIWALRQIAIPDDAALEYLMWAMRHPDDNVKINAALALAHRFGGHHDLQERLAACAQTGPSSATQAAAVLALGNGWPDAPETADFIEWARRQPSTALRLVGLYLVQRGRTPGRDADVFRPEEREWLLSSLRREGALHEPWPAAEVLTFAAAGDAATADFALSTLMTNGRDGGDRGLAWILACHAFADDSRFRQWAATQLAEPAAHGLILYNVDMIPQQWRDDPAFAQALRTYVDAALREPMAYRVAGVASGLPAAEIRASLLRALDGSLPYTAARLLVDRDGADDDVRADLTNRLRGEFARAAPLANVAIDVLGPQEGFKVLVSLLRQPDTHTRHEGRVVVAQAIAEAWKRFEDAAQDTGPDAAAARAVLADHDPAELAGLCAAVDPHPLTWHVPAVIAAWPEQPAIHAFVDKLIDDPNPDLSGIPDIIPAVILDTYAGRTDASSARIVDKTLNLFGHLEPELREVLVFELARSPLAMTDLMEVLAAWKTEPDTEIRRSSLIVLIQAIQRDQRAHNAIAEPDSDTCAMDWLRGQVRDDLCAYGPDSEARRQLAWIGMLMLDDLGLIDGIEETIGETKPASVELDVLYTGRVDPILVDLVAEHWEQLIDHFGDGIFDRLNRQTGGQPRTASQRRRNVMSALATVATRHPAIAEMLRREVDSDPTLRQDGRFLAWAKDENRGSETVLRAFLDSPVGETNRHHDRYLESLLDRDSWFVSDAAFKALLTADVVNEGSHRLIRTDRLAVYAQLFPSDELSVAAIRELEGWFESDPATRVPREWDESLAISFGAAEASDLPALAIRAHTRLRMGMPDRYLAVFTTPLARRLRVDPAAVDAFKTALDAPMNIREKSPIMAGPWDPIADAHPELQPAQRAYLFALVLQQAGASPAPDASVGDRILQSGVETVVQNPFTGEEMPLRLAVLDL